MRVDRVDASRERADCLDHAPEHDRRSTAASSRFPTTACGWRPARARMTVLISRLASASNSQPSMPRTPCQDRALLRRGGWAPCSSEAPHRVPCGSMTVISTRSVRVRSIQGLRASRSRVSKTSGCRTPEHASVQAVVSIAVGCPFSLQRLLQPGVFSAAPIRRAFHQTLALSPSSQARRPWSTILPSRQGAGAQWGMQAGNLVRLGCRTGGRLPRRGRP